MTQRDQLIDNLRGFSMIVIIFTHATAFFPSDKLIFTLWNWSNFAVPIFIFCSVYLFFQKSLDKPIHFFLYLKKRLIRLLPPYYIFLFFFLLLLLILSPQTVTIQYIWQSIVLLGGVDINWLVLLFVYITILSAIFIWSLQKSKGLFLLFFLLSFGSSIFLLFHQFALSYKFTMWLPWTVMLYFTWFYIKYEKKRVWLFIVSFLLLIFSLIVLQNQHHDAVLIHNKYPPNLFYLSFGTTVLLGLIFVDKYLFNQRLIVQSLYFFSRYSYGIFFLHYLILTLFAAFIKQLHFNGITLFLSVLLTTVVVQKLFVFLKTDDIMTNIYKKFFFLHQQQ